LSSVVVVVFRLFLLLLGFLSEGNAAVLKFVNKVAIIFRLCIFFPNKTVIDPLDILTIMLVSIKLTMESEREGKSLYRSRLSVRRR